MLEVSVGGGAIFLDESDASLIANNCQFLDNNAASGGGAVYLEDGSTATFNNCFFYGNKVGENVNHVQDEDDKSSHFFNNCLFIGSGSIDIEVNAIKKSVKITPNVDDDVNYVVLYKYGSEYARKACNNGDTATFDNLERGTYTVYMMKNWESRYEYSGTTFTIIEPYFILDDEKVFETLSAAVNAITTGTGVITVQSGTYTESANFNVQIRNKKVTIMPKDSSDGAKPVIFSGNSYSYLLDVGSGSQLIMDDIIITGKFLNSALTFNTNRECTITDCTFKNIINNNDRPNEPITAHSSNLGISGCTFESNGNLFFQDSYVTIDDCTFDSNRESYGGAIDASLNSDLTITRSKFNANIGEFGGAIYATRLKISDSVFTGNSADTGGAIYITGADNRPVTITHCVFDDNDATNYRNIYTQSQTREINLKFNEYDLDLTINPKDASYGSEYIVEGDFDWGSNLNNNYTLLVGYLDDEDIFAGLITVENNKFKINMGVLSGGPHRLTMSGMYTQGDSVDHFYTHHYYSDLYGNEFYLGKDASGIDKEAKATIMIDKATITLKLIVNNVSIPEIPVLNVYADYDLNYTIFIGNQYHQIEVVNGKASMQLTGLDLGNHTIVAMRSADENFNLAMNFTTFSISKTYSNFIVLSTNVEYNTLKEAVTNSNDTDIIYVKNGTYKDIGILISDKSLHIIALGNVVFDAQGKDGNFIIVNETSDVYIYGITFRGIHNRNTNYGAIVNYGDLSLNSCNFADNKITKTSFAGNGGAAIFNKGGSLEIDNCTFINNVAPLKVSTAAVTSLGNDDVSITSSKFINNFAREGGALHFKNISQFDGAIISCDFEQNIAVKGSAIYVGNNSKYLSVALSNFKKNNIKNSLGENAQLEGGVIYVNANNSDVVLDIGSSYFENNSNSDVDGGVICLDGSSNAFIKSSIFNDNNGKIGSVVLIKNPYNKKLTLFIDNSNFINNHATTGAIATSPRVTALIDDCLFANNTGENRHIYSNGFTVAHDSIFEVKDAKLKASSVSQGNNSIIKGSADIGVNIYAVANLTVAGENVTAEVKNNAFTYNAGILNHGKYTAVLNNIVDMNNNTYLMDSIISTFKVNSVSFELNVSVDNITYGETLKIVETLPSAASGTINYQLNGKYYTKEELEALKLDAGNYTIVAIYNHEDFAHTSSIINFVVYKANPTISVADVEVMYNDSIIVNIETNVPSIYTIEIDDYKTSVFINGSRSVEIDKIFEPGSYTIKVISQERVNYISNFTEATLKVNRNLATFMLSAPKRITYPNDALIEVSAPDNAVGNIAYTVSDSNNNIVFTAAQSCMDNLIIPDLDTGNYEVNAVFEGDDLYYPTDNIQKVSLSVRKSPSILRDENVPASTDSIFGEDYDGEPFIFQEDEDSDYEFYHTLDEAIDAAQLAGEGIITVRGGTYTSDDGISGIDIKGELELTIKAFEDEEVIFDCGGEDYFLHLTYDTEIEWSETVPPIPNPKNTEGPTITLENITIVRGNNNEGGAIELIAGTLTLINCNFYNNTADLGGAICIGSRNSDKDATVTALNCTFIDNTASDEGGAIYIMEDLEQESTASFYLCTFLDNYQGEDEERMINYFAGDDYKKSITSKYCIFNGNGIINSFKIDKINQTVAVTGSSTDSFDSVVLLYFNQIPLYTIYNNGSRTFNVTFEDVIGGNYTFGIMNDHDFNTYIFGEQFEIKVPNFIISEDEVYENLTDAIEAVAENGIIYANANYHVEDYMEIDIQKSFTLKNFRNRIVIFDGSGEKWFFTIAEGYKVVFENIGFTDGGMKTHASIENYGDLTLKNCTFDAFETSIIIYNKGVLNISEGNFSLNSIDKSIVWNENDLVIDSVEFSSNIVNLSSIVYNNGNAEIVSSNFTDNNNGGNGGAIYNKNSLTIKDTVFNENEGMDGGAVYNEGILNVFNSSFEDNTANGYGGAILNNNKLHIFNSSFTGGFSEKDGGALYNNKTMTVDNSTFIGNTATGNGGAIYNNGSLELTNSFFGINFADEFANIYNAGKISIFRGNTFDFYDVILIVPDGQYGIPTIITGTLDPQFNMDIQVTLPGFVYNQDATVDISEGVFEYNTGILPKGSYDVILYEVIYDINGNIYYGESKRDRLIIQKANVYINLTVENIILKDAVQATPVLKINASKNGAIYYLFNNEIKYYTITDSQAEITLASVGEGNYSVLVFRNGDENYNDAVNTTTFTVSEYEGNFVVNSTGHKFETLDEAIRDSAAEDIIYVREGNYTGANNIGLTISNKKLTISPLGDVVFYANSTDLGFLTVDENSNVTLEDIVLTGFKVMVIDNKGILTIDGCAFVNNTLTDNSDVGIIYNTGNLNIFESGFYDNKIYQSYIINSKSDIIINESTFKNNTIDSLGGIIDIINVNSAKVISTEFVENTLGSGAVILVRSSLDVLINAKFYNNTKGTGIFVDYNSNPKIENSIFSGNTFSRIIESRDNIQTIISGCIFTNNTINYIVLSQDKNLSVLESTFSANTLPHNPLSDESALYIGSDVNATVIGCLFADNKGGDYRNINSDSINLNISNSVFDAVNVDFSVNDTDYGQNVRIEGTIDIGTNFNFTVNFDINSKTYSVNVTDNKFTLDSGILNGGDYIVVLNSKDNNSNTFIFNKITKMFTVNRIDPGLKVTIANITHGEKLEINSTLDNNDTTHISYQLNGNWYNETQLENIILNHGKYLVAAAYAGNKNYISVTKLVYVEVYKSTPIITVSNAEVNYGDEIKINVTSDVDDFYTVFINNEYNESVSLYVTDNATFKFSSINFKPGKYEIKVYKIETDNYNEAFAYANLTVNKARGLFNLSNDLIDYGENANISVKVPVNASGNITYKVYDSNMNLVYNITQSCLEELIVPNLYVGKYTVTGTYEGDSYYTDASIVNSGIIFVLPKNVDLNISVSNTTYEENVTVTVNANVDGEYLVYVGNKSMKVTVINGTGNVSVPDLGVGNYTVNATAIDGNYSAFNETAFNVTPKSVSVIVSIDDITYGEDAIVWVYGEIDGEYIVEINNQNYTVNVVGGKGNTNVSDLAINEDILASVTIANNNYSAYNTTTFNVNKINSTLNIDDIEFDYNSTGSTALSYEGATGINVNVVNQTKAIINVTENAITVSGLDAGKYTLNVTTIPDEIHSSVTKTVTITVNKIDSTLSVDNVVFDYESTGTTEAIFDGAIGIIAKVENQSQAIVKIENNQINVSGLDVGTYTLNVTTIPDNNHNPVTKTATIIVNKIDSTLSVDNVVFDYESTGTTEAIFDGATGIIAKVENQSQAIVKIENNQINVSGLDVGTYTLNVTTIPDNNHNPVTKTATITVNKIDSTLSVVNVELNYGVSVNVSVETEGAIGIIAKIDDKYVNVNEFSIPISGLDAGTYTLSVTTIPDANHNPVTKTATIIVNKIDSTLSVDNVVFDYGSTGTTEAIFDGATGITAIVKNQSSAVVKVNDGEISVSGLDAGTYTLSVTTIPDANHNPVTKTADIIVNKIDSTLSVDNVVFDYGSTGTTEAIFDGATGITAIVKNQPMAVVKVNDGEISVSGLDAGTYTLSVTTIPDANHNPVTKTADIIVNKIDSTLSVDNVVFDYGSTGISEAIFDGATGITAIVKNQSRAVVKVNGGEISVSGLDAGSYTLSVTTIPDANHNPVTKTADIIVNKIDSTLSVDNVVFDYGSTGTTEAIFDGATGITAIVKNQSRAVVKVNNGVISVSGLDAGSYTLSVTTIPDANHNPVIKTADIIVNKIDSTLSVDNVVFDYGSTGTTEAIFDGATGITAIVKNQPRAVVKVNNGVISVSGLNAGTYTLIVTTIPDANHNPVTKTADITVNKLKTVLTGDAINTTIDVEKELIITLKDINGTPLSGKNIAVDLNGVNTYVSDKNGQVKVSTKGLTPNAYTAKVTFNGDTNYEKSTMNINVTITDDKIIVSAPDLIKYYSGPERFVVNITNGEGKPIVNKEVNIIINGVVYTRTTDENGLASLGIGLNEGQYPVYILVDNIKVNSTVIVKSTNMVRILLRYIEMILNIMQNSLMEMGPL